MQATGQTEAALGNPPKTGLSDTSSADGAADANTHLGKATAASSAWPEAATHTPRILLLITGMTMGGAEKVVAALADVLVEAGCKVELVYMTGPMQVHPSHPAVVVRTLGIVSRTDLARGYMTLRQIVRTFKPDIVHAHMFHAIIMARLLRLSLAVPRIISTMHTGHPGKGRVRTLAYRLTDVLTDISTNVSIEAADSFVAAHAVPAGRMAVIHNGIAVDRFRHSTSARARVREAFAIAPGCRLWLAVGRLNWSKDYPNLLQALLHMPADFEVQLLVVGDGPLKGWLLRMVEDLGLAGRVHFLGIRDDVADLMSAADVFVLPSVQESFGLVVAEAMACECVVVATDSGGVREVLGDAGFLVPTLDPRALASALETASALSATRAAELGRQARKRIVECYSADLALRQWRSLYGSLLSAGSPAER